MKWACEICRFETPRKTDLLKHYRLRHGHGGESLPCLYWECCCLKHGAACEPTCHSIRDTVTLSTVLSFKCSCCPLNTISTAREYFEHIGHHLKKQETMCCVFENCPFKTNICGTFASHRSRKHTPLLMTSSLSFWRENNPVRVQWMKMLRIMTVKVFNLSETFLQCYFML